MIISIVIPTFERPQYLERLLNSISKQTWQDFEVIVVDDCSEQKNAYLKVIEKFQISLPSLTYMRNTQNQGAPYSRNRGIDEAKGSLIALVDDDDEWMPDKLSLQHALFEKGDDRLGLVYTWTKAMKNGKVVHQYDSEYCGNSLRELLLECFIPSPSVMVKKQALTDAGCFDTALPSCQDWDMWTRILAKGYTCAVVKSFETLYHKHDGETIGSSPHASKGYELYYQKHMSLYKKYHKRLYSKMLLKKGVKKIIKKFSF